MTHFFSYYESAQAASNEMLDAARRQDWEALVQAERRCAVIIAMIRASDAEARLDEEKRRRKAEIIRRLLAQDAEIRRLLEPRVSELERMLNGAATRRRLDAAYRA